jgi:hypothetical protein
MTDYKSEELHSHVVGTPAARTQSDHYSEHHYLSAHRQPAPKHTAPPKADVKAKKAERISARELELLALIDGHIARLLAERNGH